MSELVEMNIDYEVHVNPPKSVKKNQNLTLHFSLDHVSMTGLGRESKDRITMEGLGNVYNYQTTAYKNFTPPKEARQVKLNRDVKVSEEIEKQKLDVMPGFILSWWYTGAEVTPERNYKDKKETKNFVR